MQLTRTRGLLAVASAFVTLVAGISVAQASEKTYDFQATGVWSFVPGAETPYRLTAKPYVGRSGPDNIRLAVREYQRVLRDEWKIATDVDGVYGPGTARSVGVVQDRLAAQAAELGLDLGVRGSINANTAYLMVRPIIEREAASEGVRPGLLSCHAKLEGGYDLGAALDNKTGSIEGWDLGPAQFSVKWNRDRGIETLFNAAYAYDAMAKNDGAHLRQYQGNELAAAYSWNAPTDADRVARGATPTGNGRVYMDWINTCLQSAYGR